MSKEEVRIKESNMLESVQWDVRVIKIDRCRIGEHRNLSKITVIHIIFCHLEVYNH